MIVWLSANWVTLVVLAVLGLILGLALGSVLGRRRKKACGCGCGCTGCVYGSTCGKKEE